MRVLLIIVGLLAAVPLAAETPEVCREHDRYGRVDKADICYVTLTDSANPADRAEGYWGLGRYDDANDQFKLAEKAAPENADLRVRWGLMYLEHYQPADAAGLFQEALELDKKNARAMLGLARVASGGFETKAVEMAAEALKTDPNLVEAQEFLAYLALEDSTEDKAVEEANKALEMSDKALDAMAVLATVDLLHDQPDTEWFHKIFKINPVYGQAYATAAHFLVLNRRYEEGIELYGQALEKDPRLWAARSQRGVNLMRLGLEGEARKELEYCYDNHWRDPETVNTLTLMDSYERFRTFRTEKTILRLHNKEAELLRPYFQGELDRAMTTFEKKYKLKLERPVQLEVYPDHEDFAVRTMGMPGLGALGVTFGHVVAMDSPSGREPGDFHWASTLWHELSHVYTIAATKERVPRWFTEGMAVHEETAASPEWGDRMNTAVIKALKEEKLLPLAGIDRGFIRPSYPAQVTVSYFQAGKICDYINERWGFETLLGMLDDYREKMTTPDVVEKRLGMTTEEFDEQFLAWLNEHVGATVEGFEKWTKDMKALSTMMKMDNYREVIEAGPKIRDAHPGYVDSASAYEMIAEAHLKRDDKKAAAAELERYVRAGGRNPELIKKLGGLQTELGRKADAAATLNRLNLIYPVNDEDLHRDLGDLFMELGDLEGSIREYGAVVSMNPIDQAASEFNLAKAYKAAERPDEALEHVILALEAAPGYRPAQQMLLELSGDEKE
jgi:tetratricopeptide (TPR) repeat protein